MHRRQILGAMAAGVGVSLAPFKFLTEPIKAPLVRALGEGGVIAGRFRYPMIDNATAKAAIRYARRARHYGWISASEFQRVVSKARFVITPTE